MEQHCDLYTTFVGLANAFDTVSKNGLWKIMSKFGCPHKFITIDRQFNEGMQARVLDDGEPSESFPGVRQSCVLAPKLFSLMFSSMLTDAFRDCDAGIRIRHRSDGKLFNLRRLQVVTKVKETCTVIGNFLFADDRQCALNTGSEQEMQLDMDRFSTACDNFGLTMSTKKTEAMFQPAPSSPYHDPINTVEGQKIQAVKNFTYLENTLSLSANIDVAISNRISKASAASSAFGRLKKTVWERRGIPLATKLKVYRPVVLTTLPFGCESWTTYRRHEKQLNHFHLRCLRTLPNIRWQDKISHTEVLQKANVPSIISFITRPNSDGQVIALVYLLIASRSSCSTGSSAKVSALLVASASDSMTVSRSDRFLHRHSDLGEPCCRPSNVAQLPS